MTEDGKKVILIVDDDVSVRDVYAEVLQNAGFVVEKAGDGVEAIAAVSKAIPDLVFTGIIMPRMDGFSLAETLKKNVSTANVPVVFSSHLGRLEDKRRADELGARGFFILGMTSPNEVVANVKAILSGGEYTFHIDLGDSDSLRLAHDLGIDPAFTCEGGRYRLRLRITNKERKLFEAELVCSA